MDYLNKSFAIVTALVSPRGSRTDRAKRKAAMLAHPSNGGRGKE